MSFEPYLRAADDGTFELLVPSAGGAVHVLPYCFHTEEDAADWLATRKGSARIRKVRSRYGKIFAPPSLYASHGSRAL
jgi:hypothetical protein